MSALNTCAARSKGLNCYAGNIISCLSSPWLWPPLLARFLNLANVGQQTRPADLPNLAESARLYLARFDQPGNGFWMIPDQLGGLACGDPVCHAGIVLLRRSCANTHAPYAVGKVRSARVCPWKCARRAAPGRLRVAASLLLLKLGRARKESNSPCTRCDYCAPNWRKTFNQ